MEKTCEIIEELKQMIERLNENLENKKFNNLTDQEKFVMKVLLHILNNSAVELEHLSIMFGKGFLKIH